MWHSPLLCKKCECVLYIASKPALVVLICSFAPAHVAELLGFIKLVHVFHEEIQNLLDSTAITIFVNYSTSVIETILIIKEFKFKKYLFECKWCGCTR